MFMVDEPQVAVDFGSVVAAPYVKMILEDTLNYMGVEPVFDENTKQETREVIVPDVTGKDLSEAARILREAGLDYLAEQTGTIVTRQMPLPDAEVLGEIPLCFFIPAAGNRPSFGGAAID